MNLGGRLVARLFNTLAKYNDEKLSWSLYCDNKRISRAAYKNCRAETQLVINEQKKGPIIRDARLLAGLMDFLAKFEETTLLRKLYKAAGNLSEKAYVICLESTKEAINCTNIRREG